MTRLLGFDYGLNKIGVAVGQTLTRSASPLTILRARHGKPDWPSLAALIEEWQPEAFVVGLPFNMDDSEVDWSPRVHRFGRQLEGRFRRPVHLVDERLTTIEARRLLREGHAGNARSPVGVDALAAALILETWLSEQDAV
ncbi:Holliday junction resolvase RuvX [Thiocapsa imhoffii]|uniref:Putative pre-16S rRNA nuclease n=1 Tax=Thiocapsa imhoffii TaxID=382777 RepID=A0A9X0WGK9_9GAMM|nr:Holliday junction resolvase RuvX [Thiocapsa imhoffii]MBK1644228.1 Holliday junction resolvase RuvX [Thiocapsa imhoffii]